MVLKKLKRFFTINHLVRLIGLIFILVLIAGSTKYLEKRESSLRQKIECVNQLINTSEIRNVSISDPQKIHIITKDNTNTIDYIKKYIGNSSCNPLLKKWSPGEPVVDSSILSLPAPNNSHSIPITRGKV
jgi:hypothetical protein